MSILKEAYELHDSLNHKIWNNDKTLKEDVLQKLKDIADAFIKYIDIPLNIVDIDIVGSNASYNYNENSDLDLHIIVNNELNYIDDAILQQLYNAKKNAFNNDYDLYIEDIPVELYIEDVLSGNATNGRYSILNNEWLLEPTPIHYNVPDVSKELDEYLDKCNDAISSKRSDTIKELINEIYMNRKLGLADEGELSVGNLVFKELRNLGLLDELRQSYYSAQSEELSL